jgi:hypothetical protein
VVHGCMEELGHMHREYHIGCLHSYPRLILLHVPLSRSKLGLAREKTRSPINRDNFYQTVYRRFAPQRGNNLIAG